MASVHTVLPFDLGGQRFALPHQQVVRVLPALQPTPLPVALPAIAGICNVHGQLLPVLDICAHLGWPAAPLQRWSHWIWVRTSQRELMLPVDRSHPVCDISSELFSTMSLHMAPNVIKGVLRGSDGLFLLQDMEVFLSRSDEAVLTQALADYASH
ncbi:chemotaxis protein CheW [Chitinimonas naiadis]